MLKEKKEVNSYSIRKADTVIITNNENFTEFHIRIYDNEKHAVVLGFNNESFIYFMRKVIKTRNLITGYNKKCKNKQTKS